MESAKHELQLVSNMIMCGDHPSITKTELNAKECKPKDDEKSREVNKFTSHGRLTPTTSHTERVTVEAEARRRARSLELAERADLDAPANRALVHAAVGSFRWPPYLLCVWVLVLLLTHALHCLVAVLEGALPALRNWCVHGRGWTEAAWRAEGARARSLALAGGTGALYALLAALLAARAAARWALEPLCDADAPALLADYERYEHYEIGRRPSKSHLNAKQ